MKRNSLRALQQTGVAFMASAALLMASTSFISPGANATNEAAASPIITRNYTQDSLAKRDSLAQAELLVQKEVELPDGSFSDGDPLANLTAPIDGLYPGKTGLLYNVKQDGIPTVAEGGSATFRIRIYPRRTFTSGDAIGPLDSKITVVDTTDVPGTPGSACSITEPYLVRGDEMVEYKCTLTNLKSKPGSTEDLINTIVVTSTDVNGENPLTATDKAAVDVLDPVPAASPCLTIKKYVRQAGTTNEYVDAQTADTAAIIANGATAEYRIVVTNITGQPSGCVATPLTDVTVTDNTQPGCTKIIGTLAAGAVVTYDNNGFTVVPADAATITATTGCSTTNVTSPGTSTATVTAKGPNSDPAPASDPVNITAGDKPEVTTTTVSPTTTVTPTTTAPPVIVFSNPPAFPVTTVAATTVPAVVVAPTVAPTTVVPSTVRPTTSAAPGTTAAPSVSVLGVQVAEPVSDAPLAITGSSQSRPMMMMSLLILMIGCALVLVSKVADIDTRGKRQR